MAADTRRGAMLGIVVTALIAVLGWSISVESRLSAAQSAVERVERDTETIRTYLQSIDQRLARIEGKLDRR
jgi:hypothetical protein